MEEEIRIDFLDEITPIGWAVALFILLDEDFRQMPSYLIHEGRAALKNIVIPLTVCTKQGEDPPWENLEALVTKLSDLEFHRWFEALESLDIASRTVVTLRESPHFAMTANHRKGTVNLELPSGGMSFHLGE